MLRSATLATGSDMTNAMSVDPEQPEPSPRDLRGRVALVTGAGQRVGAAIARALGRRGMRVAVHFHRSRAGAEDTAAAVREAGGEAELFSADLYDAEAARRLVTEVVAKMGGLELLVPSAANFDAVAFESIAPEHWQRALDLNLLSPFWMAKAAAPSLRASRGSIVFITGYSTQTPYPGYLPYMVSKGGLSQLTRVLALELGPEVRVNAVAPGTVLPPADMSPEQVRALVEPTPLRRVGSAEDVAEAVAYLAGAVYVTGHELRVDGGRHLGA